VAEPAAERLADVWQGRFFHGTDRRSLFAAK